MWWVWSRSVFRKCPHRRARIDVCPEHVPLVGGSGAACSPGASVLTSSSPVAQPRVKDDHVAGPLQHRVWLAREVDAARIDGEDYRVAVVCWQVRVPLLRSRPLFRHNDGGPHGSAGVYCPLS